MKNTVKTTMLAIAAILLFAAAGRPAMAGEHENDTLKGISGMWVLVEGFGEDDKRAGFNEQTFQTDVELKLRLAGIKVLAKKEWFDEPGAPFLYLNVNPLHDQQGEHAAYSIDLALKQEVCLVRNPGRCVLAPTWSVGAVGRGDLQHVRDSAKDLVDQFINAWLSVNPK